MYFSSIYLLLIHRCFQSLNLFLNFGQTTFTCFVPSGLFFTSRQRLRLKYKGDTLSYCHSQTKLTWHSRRSGSHRFLSSWSKLHSHFPCCCWLKRCGSLRIKYSQCFYQTAGIHFHTIRRDSPNSLNAYCNC